MSIPAPFTPFSNNLDDNMQFNNRPINTSHNRSTIKQNVINQYYIGHIYSTVSTVPVDYLYWFSQPPVKTLTVTGESKSQILNTFRNAVSQSKLEAACITGIELHCSGYLQQVINILIEIIGSHVHIHNPNIGSRLLERYKRFENQINLPEKGAGTVHFPNEEYDELFFNKPEVLGYRTTLNCQPVRNFVIEMISVVTLSHQKQMTLPIINQKDVNNNYLYSAAKSLKIGGTNLMKVIEKNELKIVLEVIEKYLLHKESKTEEAIYWILWLIKLESKIKKKGESIPCKAINVNGVHKKHTDHWVWYIWKSLFSRVSFCSSFKKKQIIDLYEIFKIDFTKTIIIIRLPILFFAIRLLKYDISNNFPSILNNIHLHVQAYSNVNTLYRNLQIKLATKSWVSITGNDKIEKAKQPKKITNKMLKELENKKSTLSLREKTAYLDIIPKADNHF
jgi:hypothetical protein